MQAVFLKQYGPAADAFSIRETETPTPVAGQVRIKTEAFGLNFAEVMARLGMYPDSPEMPFVPGYDVVGMVDAIGEGVDPSWQGKRVAAMVRFGSYAEYVIADPRGITAIGDMPAGEAAALCVQYATAYHCAIQCLNLLPGDRVLVHAAAGGVGTALVQLCKWKGCEVFALAGSDEKCARARANGADHAINHRTTDYHQALQNLLSGNRLDASFNAVAGKTFKTDMRLLGAGGKLVLFGAATRTDRRRGKWGTVRLLADMGLVIPLGFVGSSKGVIGVNILRIADHKPQLLSRAMRELVSLWESGVVRPAVGGVYALDALAEAHTALEERKTTGKVIVAWSR